MKTRQRHAAAWLALSCLALPAPAAAARVARLIGKVVDSEGKPLAGVRVTTTSTAVPDFNAVTETDNKGIFKVDFEKTDVVYVYQLEKAGLVPLRVEQKWTVEGTDRHEFKMTRTEAPQVGELAAGAPAAGEAGTGAAAAASSPGVEAFNAGVRAFKAKDYETAAARLQEASQQDPSLRQAWVALSAAYMQQRRYAQAAEAAEKAIALGATDASVLETRWEAYRQVGDQAKAAQARQELERIGRLAEEAKGVYNDGIALQKFGDDDRALAKFQAALELDPNFEPALLALAASALKLGRPADAAAAAETALKNNPGSTEALKLRYNAALKLKDEAKIVEALRGLAAVDGAAARDGLFLMARAAFDRDDMKAAKERLARVLAIEPSHARAHFLLGMILMREGSKQESRAHLQRFLELAPGDPDAATARDAIQFLK